MSEPAPRRLPATCWPGIVRFYEKLVHTHGFDLEPMVTLVRRIASSPSAISVYPSTSHEALGLSRVEHSAERLENPMVQVSFDRPTRAFHVAFQDKQGRTVREEARADVLAVASWNEILTWLGVR